MNFTKENLDILKNLTKLNEVMYLTSDELAVSSADKTCVCYYKWDLKLQKDFGVSDIANILGVISLYGDPEYLEEDTQFIIKKGREKTIFRHVSRECIKQMIPPPRADVFTRMLVTKEGSFSITGEDLAKIKNHSAILRNPHIKIAGNQITSYSRTNSSSNTYSIDLDPSVSIKEKVIKEENLGRIIGGNYQVDVYDRAVVFNNGSNLVYVLGIVK